MKDFKILKTSDLNQFRANKITQLMLYKHNYINVTKSLRQYHKVIEDQIEFKNRTDRKHRGEQEEVKIGRKYRQKMQTSINPIKQNNNHAQMKHKI